MGLKSIKLALCGVLGVALCSSLLAQPQRWTAGEFRGLTAGRASRQDVARVLGQPDAVDHGKNGDTLLYRGRGEHKGDITLQLNAQGTVIEIREAFPVAIPRTRLDKEMGGGGMTAHFSQAACAGGALYRDPKGFVELTFYPARGVALWPDQYGYDFAAMLYVARQPGLARKPACVLKH